MAGLSTLDESTERDAAPSVDDGLVDAAREPERRMAPGFTFEAIQAFATYTDEFLDHMLNFVKKQGKALTKDALAKESARWLKSTKLLDEVVAALEHGRKFKKGRRR